MKHIRYSAAAILLGTFLSVSPVVANAPSDDTQGTASSAVVADTAVQDTSSTPAETEMVVKAREQVVARVNGVDIYMFDLVGMMNRVAKAYYSKIKEPTDEITAEIKQRALDRLIFEELAVKEAEKQGIDPKPEDVQKVIDELKNAYEGEEGYQNYLKEIGATDKQLRERIIRSQRLEGITGREVYQKLIKKEDAIQKAYEQYKSEGKLKKAEKFIAKELLVMDTGDQETTRKHAEKLLAELKAKNNDFGKLVLDGTFIVRRLAINKSKYPVVYSRMQEMEVGQFSDVVEDNGTFHIFEVVQNDPARDLTVEEASTFIEDKLAVHFQEQRRAEWVQELRKDAKIEILDVDLKNVLMAKPEEKK